MSNFSIKKIYLIAAICENNGIGIKGDLPWRLKKEMAYFTKMTSTTEDSNKQNAVVMGRKTWESIPKKYKPLANRLNVVISKTASNFKHDDHEIPSYKSVTEAITSLNSSQFSNIESIWIIGGYGVYKEGLEKKFCNKLYITRVKKEFECDTFFPDFSGDGYELIEEDNVPSEEQEEKGLKFKFEVYKNNMI